MTDKLKIGIIDLLTILLPGAFMVIAIWFYYKPFEKLLDNKTPLIKYEWIDTSLFLGGAYILGHFVYLLASFLDDLIYEKVKRVYWHDHKRLVAYVLQMKERRTGISDRKVLSAFKWSTSYLIAREPAIYAEVEKYMAESKFFRSLFVVLVIALFILVVNDRSFDVFLIIITLAFLSLIRYLTQRQKSIELAYHGMLTLSGEVFPKDPDQEILIDLEKDNLYPFKSPGKKNNVGLPGSKKPGTGLGNTKNFRNSIVKLFYAIGLCIVPGFERLISREKHT